jgi:8-amino-7-oxononanoate synthase
MAFGWIDEQARLRRRAGLERALRPRAADARLLDLAGNDYLGLARHPEVV